MRTRLHIKLIPLKGLDFYEDFFDEDTGELLKEAAIETIYNNKTLIASNTNIEIVKKGWSDGWMQFKYPGQMFFGYQEVKRKVPCTELQFRKQLLQALKYFYDDTLNTKRDKKVKVFCLNSERFYTYVLRSDLEELFKDLFPAFELTKESASDTWKDPLLKSIMLSHKIPFRVYKMPDTVELHNILRDIYLQCLD